MLASIKPALAADLFFFDFCEGFAIDAEGCGGARFKTANADLNTAGIAVAVIIVLDQLKGAVDFFDQLTLAVAVCAAQG